MTRCVMSALGVPSRVNLARHVALVSAGSGPLDTIQVLFDTGANDASYLAGSWVEVHRDSLEKHMHPDCYYGL